MPPTSLVRVEHLVDEGAARFPQKTALVYGERTWTYAQLAAEVHRRAALLVEAGFVAGDVIATTEPPTDDLAITLLACCRADLTTLSLASTLTARESAPLLALARTAALLTAEGQPHPDHAALPALPLALPGHARPSAITEAARRSAEGDVEAVACLIPTSGTTGAAPKLVRAPHRSMTWRRSLPVWWEEAPNVFFRPRLSYFQVRNFYELLSRFGTIVLSQTLDPERMEAGMVTCGATALMANPVSLQLLATQSRPPILGLTLRVVRTGGMLVPHAVREAAAHRYGATILEEYASSEGGAIMTTPQEGAPYGSVGRPYHGVDARIVDDDGTPVPLGERGELIVRSPAVMLGYLENDDATAQALRDGWLWTGDLARQDSAGLYYLEGRRASRINVGGFKFAPEEVEAVLAEHPSVREAAVVPVEDEKRGQVVKAVLVVHGEPPTVRELRRWCQERMAGYKVPRQWEFRQELPRSPLGKIRRHHL